MAASTRCARPASSSRPSPSRACRTTSRSRSSSSTDLGDGRTELVATSLVDSFADRDAFVASGMEGGVREGYEKLDELLARPALPGLQTAIAVLSRAICL